MSKLYSQPLPRSAVKDRDAKLTPEIARDLCQRVGSKAYIEGSIGVLGNEYVIGLKAANCTTGDSLAEEQVQAQPKEKVFDALGRAASGMREKLGESLSTVEKLDTPMEEATTPSIEALQVLQPRSKGPQWCRLHRVDTAPPPTIGNWCRRQQQRRTCFPFTCAAKPISRRIRAPKPPPSSRKSSTIEESF